MRGATDDAARLEIGELQVLARETVATCLHARTGVRHRRSSRGSERTGLFVLECLQRVEVSGSASGELPAACRRRRRSEHRARVVQGTVKVRLQVESAAVVSAASAMPDDDSDHGADQRGDLALDSDHAS